MWSDNESKIDLLGFGHLLSAITSVVSSDSLLPATLGIFGDWGSGKSSLLEMARSELERDDNRLVLSFNGWLFEGYEDAKTSLVGTILDELAHRKTTTVKARELVVGLLRRVNMMRVLVSAGRAAGAYAVGGAPALGLVAGGDLLKLGSEIWEKAKQVDPQELGKFLKDNEPGSALRQGVREFRVDFAKLLEETKVKTLVVMIDDLDRCLPDSIIEILEAIKLFLFVPHTAFVIGADERLVKYAVRRRFPELPGERVEVGRDYLEKLVQFPIRIPPLGRAEMETYINLLMAERGGLSEEDREKARERVVRAGPESLLDVKFNRGIAEELFGKVGVQLADSLTMAERIAPVLASGLLGNPRQCKRFLNTLIMRLEMARSRGIELKQRVLSKLMLLEYFAPEFFRRLAELQGEEQGRPRLIAEAEDSVSGKEPSKTHTNKKSKVGDLEESPKSRDLITWLSDRWTGEWLASEPRLTGEDLRPYFFFSRDRLGPLAGAAQRMSPRAQETLAELFHESAAVRSLALKKSKDLSPADVAAVFESLADRTRQEDDHGAADSALNRIFDWIAAHPELFSQLVALLTNLSESGLSPSLVVKLLNLAEQPEKEAMAKKLLEKWSESASNDILKKAAEGRLKSGK